MQVLFQGVLGPALSKQNRVMLMLLVYGRHFEHCGTDNLDKVVRESDYTWI